MKIQYFSDTDTLYFDLTERPSSRTEVVTDNFIVDFDSEQNVVGITLEHASQTIDLSIVEMINLLKTVVHAS